MWRMFAELKIVFTQPATFVCSGEADEFATSRAHLVSRDKIASRRRFTERRRSCWLAIQTKRRPVAGDINCTSHDTWLHKLLPFFYVVVSSSGDRNDHQYRVLISLSGVMSCAAFLSRQVASDGVAVCHLEPKQFVGSMAFSRFISNVNVNVKPEAAPSPSAADGDGSSESRGSDAGPVATSALSTEVGTNDSDVDDEDDDDDQLEYIDDMYVPGGAGVFEEAREAALGLLRQDSFVGDVAKSFGADSGAGKGPCGLESSLTSVTATTDVSAEG